LTRTWLNRRRRWPSSTKIHVERDSRGYIGTVTKLPTVFGFGTSRQAALDNARRHLKWALAYLIEAGRTPSPNR
jgi:hypothetical protein